MSKYPQGSLAWWRQLASRRQYIIDVISRRVKELEADYDLVEAELRQRIESCTCQKDVD